MLGAFGPAPVAANHAPPDTDIFHRLEPAHVAELVRLVEVEFEIVFDQPRRIVGDADRPPRGRERRSEEHTSELQSLMRISYAVFCLKKKRKMQHKSHNINE